jgi:hypothetical protein
LPSTAAIRPRTPWAGLVFANSFVKVPLLALDYFTAMALTKVNSLSEAEVFVSVSGGDLPANGGQFAGDNQFSSITSSRIEL